MKFYLNRIIKSLRELRIIRIITFLKLSREKFLIFINVRWCYIRNKTFAQFVQNREGWRLFDCCTCSQRFSSGSISTSISILDQLWEIIYHPTGFPLRRNFLEIPFNRDEILGLGKVSSYFGCNDWVSKNMIPIKHPPSNNKKFR